MSNDEDELNNGLDDGYPGIRRPYAFPSYSGGINDKMLNALISSHKREIETLKALHKEQIESLKQRYENRLMAFAQRTK